MDPLCYFMPQKIDSSFRLPEQKGFYLLFLTLFHIMIQFSPLDMQKLERKRVTQYILPSFIKVEWIISRSWYFKYVKGEWKRKERKRGVVQELVIRKTSFSIWMRRGIAFEREKVKSSWGDYVILWKLNWILKPSNLHLDLHLKWNRQIYSERMSKTFIWNNLVMWRLALFFLFHQKFFCLVYFNV